MYIIQNLTLSKNPTILSLNIIIDSNIKILKILAKVIISNLKFLFILNLVFNYSIKV